MRNIVTSKDNCLTKGKEESATRSQLLEADLHLKHEVVERKRAEQITRVLFRISNAVNTTKDLGELYASIHRILGEIIDLTNFFIAIYHKDKKRVTFPYFVDQYDTDIEYADQFSEVNSLTGEVILTEGPVFLDRADLLQRVAEKRIIGTAPNIWLGVPLKIKGEVIGVMTAQSYDDPHQFAEIDKDILLSVSDQVAFAIERKRSEQALVASEKKYRSIIESIEDGYYEFDRECNLTLFNQALCSMLGYDENALVGMNIEEYLSEPSVEVIREVFSQVNITKFPSKTIELEFKRKDGSLRFVETVVSAIRNEEGDVDGFRGIARDITERKDTEKSRKVLEEQLQQSQRLESLGTLAGGIAHDFNNILMGIQGRTSLMIHDLSSSHPYFSQLKSIEEYVQSAAGLTSRLLGFARGGKYEVHSLNLNVLLEKNIEMFGRTRRELFITTKLDENLWPIEADSSQIEQVLLNLLVNAAQAMPNGGNITISTTKIVVEQEDAELYEVTPGNYVLLSLADTGEGMDDTTIRKIFDPFFTTKAIGHGSGLGLAMVYGIIRNHSGAISVKSKVKKGTTFSILLPATETVSMPDIGASAAIKKGSETILLVDDEQMIIDVGQEILAALGYDVLTASTGQEAIERYSVHKNEIDLMIIDMIMPQMSGGELFDRLKTMDPNIKVLLSSGYSIDGQAREILNRGCKGFIQKPFSISQISERIREVLH